MNQPDDPVDIFLAGVEKRRQELMMTDGLLEIVTGTLLGFCAVEGIDALAFVIQSMERCGD